MATLKVIVGDELYVYMNGSLLYKRWLHKFYGMIFCTLGNFTANDINNSQRSTDARAKQQSHQVSIQKDGGW